MVLKSLEKRIVDLEKDCFDKDIDVIVYTGASGIGLTDEEIEEAKKEAMRKGLTFCLVFPKDGDELIE